jgi:TPR repeat protein
MRVLSVITLMAVLVLPPVAVAEVQTFTATHTYILGDHDSKDDARQRCLLEAKRKILEQAGVYIESASEVKNFDLTKDKITSFAAAVMQVKDTKETVSFQQGHMTMTMKLKANVDLAEVRKQLAVRQVDAGVREDVAAQKERLKRLEAQLEAMQGQQGGQPSGHASASPPRNISAEDLQSWRTQAAQGNAEAQNNLGSLFDQGHGVPQDYAKARQWYEKAAAQGNAEGQFSLGFAYALGQGVPQDYVQAAKWYEKAATQGNVMAQFYLGVLYASGHDGVPKDYVRAAKWYEKAAAQGHDRAQSLIGTLYLNGQGVPQDYTKARQWFEEAAAQDEMDAQFGIGKLYSMGRGGVLQDYAQAAYWYEKSAAQGYPEAQVNLGALYVNGQGVPQDYVRAYMWSNVAARLSLLLSDADQKTAADNQDKVARRMSPAQIAEAQRLAQQCQAQGFKGCE